jgi:hypothetical protein
MRRSICLKDLDSLLVMNVVLACRPKNMTIREVATSTTGEKITTYIFNSLEYTHVGSWPPLHVPGFHVPIATVKIVDTNEDITAQVKRFAGPGHIVTNDILRYAMGTWSWIFVFRTKSLGISVSTKPKLVVPDRCPAIAVTNILGQTSIFWAK